MDELDFDFNLCESLCLSHETNLQNYFSVNETKYCDLFEIQLYNDLADDIMLNDSEMLNEEIERLVAAIAA